MAFKKFIKQDTFFPVALILLSVALLAGLAVFAYLGTFSRYSADDYCFTRTLDQSSNILSATKAWYVKTSNRYTTMLLVGVSEWFGRAAIRYLPALAIIFWLVTLAWVLFRLAEKLRISYPLVSAFTLACLIVFYSILQAPSLYQSLFWRSGMVTYFTPLIAFSYLSGFLMIEGWRREAALLMDMAGRISLDLAWLLFSRRSLRNDAGHTGRRVGPGHPDGLGS